MGHRLVVTGFTRLLDRPANKLRLAFLVLLAAAGLCHPACAITINVPADQPTIQAGINAAKNGDTVLVAPGTYNENIRFNGKAITVISSGGPSVTTIDGGYKPGVATVIFANGETSASVISGFTIRGGGDTIFAGTSDGGVYVGNASPTIQGNTITANYCHNIDVEVGIATIFNNEVSGVLQGASGSVPESYCTFGSGINLQGSPDSLYLPSTTPILGSTVIHNTIQNNLTGSGINLWAAQNVLIMNNTIRDNVSPVFGSAITSANSIDTVVAQNLIYGNTSSCGGALQFEDSGPGVSTLAVLVTNNTIVDNVMTPTLAEDSACAYIAQIYPSAYSYGLSGPGVVIVNNIISGSTSYPAVNCGWYDPPSLADQPTFQNNILYNAGGPFFGSYCVDVSNQDGNIAADPQFVDPSTGNYQLKSTSPAIDSGQNTALQTFQTITGLNWTQDFASNPRIQDATGKGCIIDMGAYEVPGTVSVCGVSETLTSSLNPALAGQSVTFTAQLSSTSGTPTGSIQFLDGTTLLSTQTVSNSGSASFTTNSLTVGSHTITANYQPAGTFGASTASLIQVINGDATNTTLISSLNPATIGQSVTFTATVTSTQGTPTGSIVFADGSTTLATVALAGNTASFTTSSLTGGNHTITATYSPTGSFAGSSGSLVETINGAPTATTLASSANPAYALQPVTLTAAVTSTATGTPTGTVTFMDGATALGTSQLSASGTATLSVSFASAGNHALRAVYSGDNNFNGSSASFTESVLINPTTTTLVATPLSPGAFTPVTLTATVSSATAAQYAPGAVPAGSVTFYDGATPLGTATLNATGTASLTISSLQAGFHALTAAYAGNQSFQASTSPIFGLFVAPDATVTSLTGTPNPAGLGTAVTFTATVASAATTVMPTGAVSFHDGRLAIGQGTLNAQGQAVFTTSTLAIGTHPITAIYTGYGNLNFTSSVSSAFQETITPFLGDFTLSATPNTFTLYTGQSGNSTITATAEGGFNNDLALTCTGLPAGSACEFNFAKILGGNGQDSLIITTAAPQAAAAHSPSAPWRSGSLATLAFLIFIVVPRRRWRIFLALIMVACCLGSFTGCSSPGPLTPGTPPGTYTITVTAQAANSGQVLAHTTTINLTVKSLF